MLCLAWLPFDRVYSVSIGFMTVTPYYVGIVLVFITTLVKVVFDRERFVVTATDFALGAVCFMYLCSTLLSDIPQTAGLLAFRAIFIPTLTYFVCKALLQDEEMLLRALNLFAVGIGVLAGAALVAFVISSERPEPFGRDGVAMASMAIVPLMVGLYGVQRGHRLWRLVMIGGGLVAVGVSISRAYWIFVLLSPLFFRLFMRGRAFMVALAMLATSLLLTLWITTDASSFATVRINNQEDHGIQRVLSAEHWKAAIYNRVVLMYAPSLEQFERRPIFGRGLYVAESQATTTHNLHLEWLESGGLLGYLAFAALYLTHFRNLSRRARGDPMSSALGIASLAILINGITNGIMHSVMPTVAMMCLGLVAARLQGIRRREVETAPIRLVWQPTVRSTQTRRS